MNKVHLLVVFLLLSSIFNIYGQKSPSSPLIVELISDDYRVDFAELVKPNSQNNLLDAHEIHLGGDAFYNINQQGEDDFVSYVKLDSTEYTGWDYQDEKYYDFTQYAYYNEIGQRIEYNTFIKTDSGFEKYDKNEYSYNDSGQRILYRYLQWDESLNDWDEKVRTEYIYSENRLSSMTKLDWLSLDYRETKYDDNGYVNEQIEYIWSETGQSWVPDTKSEFERDENGNSLKFADYRWSEEDGDWYGIYKRIDSYNEIGEISEYYIYYWDQNDWLLYNKMVYEYDEQSGELILSTYYWNSIFSGEFEVSEIIKYERQYNSIGKLLEQIEYEWVENYWRERSSRQYTYDNEGNMTSLITFSSGNSASNYYYKYEYVYDDLGKQIEFSSYSKSSNGGEWNKQDKQVYAYDETGRTTLSKYYDVVDGDWAPVRKYEYLYNEYGNRVFYRESLRLNKKNGDYSLGVRWEDYYYYSPYFEQTAEIPMQEVNVGETIEIDLADYFNLYDTRNISYEVTTTGEGIVNATIEGSSLSIEGVKEETSDSVKVMMQLSPGDALELSFAVNVLAKPLGIDIAQDVVVYPNPAQDYLIIKQSSDVSSWVVLDIEGKKIDSGSFTQRKIDLTNYKAGVYVIRLQDQGSIKEFKFIKQ